MVRYTMRRLCLLVLIVFTVSGALSAAAQRERATATRTQAVDPIDELTFPIGGGDFGFQFWVWILPRVTAHFPSYDRLLMYEEAKRITGVDVRFIHPPTGQEREAFNLMISSGDLPEVIAFNWLRDFPGGPVRAMDEGIIQPLNQLIEDYMPNLRAVLAADPEAARAMRDDNGSYWGLPMVVIDELDGDPIGRTLGTTLGPQMRIDFLERIGEPIPETMADWYRVLTKFKNELGITSPLNIFYVFLQRSHAFAGAYGAAFDFFRDGGAVKFGPLEPGYRDFLAELAKWYAEGLINPDFAAQDRPAHDALNTGGQASAWIHYQGSGLGNYLRVGQSVDGDFRPAGIPYPVRVRGETPMIGYNENITGIIPDNAVAISAQNASPAHTAMWLDFWYSEQGRTLQSWGVEGVSFEIRDGQRVTIPPYDQIPFSTGLQLVGTRSTADLLLRPDFQQEASTRWSRTRATETLLPPLMPTSEESNREAAVMSEVRTYVDEMTIKFIMGVEPISGFDRYVQTLKNLGIEDVIRTKQAQYDRYRRR